MTKDEANAVRRARWHQKKDVNRAARLLTRRKWYARTKSSRRELMREYDRTTYWNHRDEKLRKNKAWRLKNAQRLKQYNRKKNLQKFGLTVEEYASLFSAQGGACAICFNLCKTGRRLAVDHCHCSGKIRGLLCQKCNHAIGLMDDSVCRLESAIRYLTRA